ncbi:MAG: aconitase family protein [Acidimicrobiales bacterium]|nr:aconitase family protein [Acidimicrobiales bacterium]
MSRMPPRRRVGRTDAAPPTPTTLVDKIWASHLAASPAADDEPAFHHLSVDRILLHEHQVGLVGRAHHGAWRVSEPDRIIACSDQQFPTIPSDGGPRQGAQLMSAVERLERTSDAVGLPLFGPGDHRGGIVNVVAAEQGMVLPGNLVVGADAHVSTLGGLGGLALVISDAEVAEVVETGTVRRPWPGVVRVSVPGSLTSDATGKDLALWLLGRVGSGAVAGRFLELVGPVVRRLSVEARMTLCNLAVEAGATAVVIAPDRLTEQYLAGRPFAPTGAAWDRAVAEWESLGTDPGADFDADLGLLAEEVRPHTTWGTHIDQVAPLDGAVPMPRGGEPAERDRRALIDQDLQPGTPIDQIEIDQVFIGSCANARVEDIRAAAAVARGGRAQVPAWVVPGSWPVKRQAEAEGLHRIFLDAGFEWRDPGCSLCIGTNGDAVAPGARLASTANRPVRALVGPGARVHIMSPASAAASALIGRLSPPSSVAD